MTHHILVMGSVFAGLISPVSSALLRDPPANLRRSATESALAMALKYLWDGVDYRNTSYSFRFLAPKPGAGTPEKSVHVLGLPHTGTNLINAILYLNFGSKLKYVDTGFDLPPTKDMSALWRHANIKEAFASDRDWVQSVGKDVSAIMMVRDPLAWLQKVHESPFEFSSCVAAKDWLSRPCTLQNPAGFETKPKQFPSPTAVWNQWNDGYFNAGGFGFPRRRVVRYEDLVGNPEAVVESLAKFLGMEKPVDGWRFPAESTGEDNSARVEAFENIHNKTYGGLFSIADQRKVCNLVDKNLKVTYSYSKLCDDIMQGTP